MCRVRARTEGAPQSLLVARALAGAADPDHIFTYFNLHYLYEHINYIHVYRKLNTIETKNKKNGSSAVVQLRARSFVSNARPPT